MLKGKEIERPKFEKRKAKKAQKSTLGAR